MQGCGGGKSDPVMTGFSGRSFNFFGDVGKTYNLISSMHHQLSMKLKLAQMWNHNGTNMEVCPSPPLPFNTSYCPTSTSVLGKAWAPAKHRFDVLSSASMPASHMQATRMSRVVMALLMQGIGFMYKDYKVLMELDGDTPKGTQLLVL